jgi:carbonic anhydrase
MAFFHARITSLDVENSLSIFNCRVAGNVENFDILGSMEFACKLSGAKVILVIGHTGAARLKALSTTPNAAISYGAGGIHRWLVDAAPPGQRTK